MHNKISIVTTRFLSLLVLSLLAPLSFAQILPNSPQSVTIAQPMQIANLQSWEFEGDPQFALIDRIGFDLEVYKNKPYVVFSDKNQNKKISVMTRDSSGTGWINVGPSGFSAGEIRFPRIKIQDDAIYVAFEDRMQQGYKISVMKYDQNTNVWNYVGQRGTSPGEARAPDLEIYKGAPYVAYYGLQHGNPHRGATVQKFDAQTGQWEFVGNAGFSNNSNIFHIDLEIANNIPYVAYFQNQNATQPRVSVHRLDYASNTWPLLGSVFTNNVSMRKDLEIHNEDVYLSMNGLYKYDRLQNTWDMIAPAQTAHDFEFAGSKPEFAYMILEGSYSMREYYARVDGLSTPPTWSRIGQARIETKMSQYIDLEIDADTGTQYLAYSNHERNSAPLSLNVKKLQRVSLAVPNGAVLSAPAPRPRRRDLQMKKAPLKK
ncbi:MAG: hypothetical protein COA43_09585 [Robiginitomaculum sp.]|nr:MAG: hypothetical protein COA43_09585 [Robiginitomaculum sp.]